MMTSWVGAAPRVLPGRKKLCAKESPFRRAFTSLSTVWAAAASAPPPASVQKGDQLGGGPKAPGMGRRGGPAPVCGGGGPAGGVSLGGSGDGVGTGTSGGGCVVE